MGNIIKQLAKEEIPIDRPTLFANRLIFEKCENIHIHYRNLRLEYSQEEFAQFAEEMQTAFLNIPKEEQEYYVLSYTPVPEQPEYFKDRISIEANKGSIHLHYKNIRLEFTKDEFLDLTDSIEKAKKELKKVKPIVTYIPLTEIEVNDGGHFINENHPSGFICDNQKQHEDRVKEVEEAIKSGKKIRPIAVFKTEDKYQRVDGFCRYIAHKNLGLDKIEVIDCPLAYAGCQDKKEFIIDETTYLDILDGKTY